MGQCTHGGTRVAGGCIKEGGPGNGRVSAVSATWICKRGTQLLGEPHSIPFREKHAMSAQTVRPHCIRISGVEAALCANTSLPDGSRADDRNEQGGYIEANRQAGVQRTRRQG